MARDRAADHGITGPEQRGQAQQQVRLVGEPVIRWRGAGDMFGGSHCGPGFLNRARPARLPKSRAGGQLPGSLRDTDLWHASMAPMHCLHARVRNARARGGQTVTLGTSINIARM